MEILVRRIARGRQRAEEISTATPLVANLPQASGMRHADSRFCGALLLRAPCARPVGSLYNKCEEIEALAAALWKLELGYNSI